MPVWNNPNTWNLNALEPAHQVVSDRHRRVRRQARRNTVGVVDPGRLADHRRLTLNLGLRYDYQPNSFANFVEVYPILKGGRPDETTDFGPRAGFAYTLNDRTVIRGGVGRYYGQVIDNLTSFTLSAATTFVAQVSTTGGRTLRPTRSTVRYQGLQCASWVPQVGHRPEYRSPPSLRRSWTMPYSWISSIGFQRQIGTRHGADVRFQLQRRAQRAAHAEQPEPDVRPGDRRELSITDVWRVVRFRVGH